MVNDTSFLLTKIIATLGPATDSQHMVERLIEEGVRSFRINFSHGDFDEHEAHLSRVRAASKKLGIPVGVMGDLSGPKIRVGHVADDGVVLQSGQTVIIQRDEIVTHPPQDEMGVGG